MALQMARPWKHPKTGIYWLRKRVPEDLKALVGKTEEKQSLRTKDPSEAKRLHVAALALLDQRWENLRKPVGTISELEAFQVAQVLEKNVLWHHRENPSAQKHWDPGVGKLVFKPSPMLDADAFSKIWETPLRDPKIAEYERSCRKMAAEHLEDLGRVVDDASRERLAVAFAHALQRSAVKLAQMASGYWDNAPYFPQAAHVVPQVTPASAAQLQDSEKKVAFRTLFEGWEREKRPTKKTAYSWQRVMNQLESFLGHDDALQITTSDLVRWKTALMAEQLQSKTIRDSKLAPLRAILQWGQDNGHLTENPAQRITMSVKDIVGNRRRSFTNEEARTILETASASADQYIRWIPLLCSCSGARIAEICQLRKEDVRHIEDTWCFVITANAGSVKNANSERIVPLHSAVIAAGFLDFVAESGDGPLFKELQPDRFGNRGGTGTKQLCRWVRDTGITDPRIGPNHSWRHRFKTHCRRYGLARDLVDAILGHGRKTVADTYGEYPIPVLASEMEKIPSEALSI